VAGLLVVYVMGKGADTGAGTICAEWKAA